jgi:hypothetical protein
VSAANRPERLFSSLGEIPTMSAPSASGRLRSFFGAPLRAQTYLNLLYLTLAFPLGLAYFVFVAVGVSLGAALALVVVGIPLLAAVFAVCLGLAGVERWLAGLLLGVELPAAELEGESTRERLASLLTDLDTWTAVVYLPTKLLFGVVSFTLVTSLLTTGAALLFVPFYYDRPGLYVGLVTDRPVELAPALHVGWNRLLVGFEAVVEIGSWEVNSLPAALAVAAFGAALCLFTLNLLNLLARVSAWYAGVMLGGSYDVVGATRRALR